MHHQIVCRSHKIFEVGIFAVFIGAVPDFLLALVHRQSAHIVDMIAVGTYGDYARLDIVLLNYTETITKIRIGIKALDCLRNRA